MITCENCQSLEQRIKELEDQNTSLKEDHASKLCPNCQELDKLEAESRQLMIDKVNLAQGLNNTALALEAEKAERDAEKQNALNQFRMLLKEHEERVTIEAERDRLEEKLKAERDALKIECDSRAIWIDKMGKILGYDNSDGFHSTPDCFELAEGLKAERDRLKARLATADQLLEEAISFMHLSLKHEWWDRLKEWKEQR